MSFKEEEEVVDEPSSSSKEPVDDPEDPWLDAIKELEEQDKLRSKIGLVIAQQYKITSRISFGSYGAIYLADDLASDSGVQVAAKFEQTLKGGAHLKYEHNVYCEIQGHTGIPKVYWFGKEFSYDIMVMELLGPTLDQMFQFCDKKFSLKTVARIGRQMVALLKHIHQRGFIHRDMKPENFLVGLGENDSTVYLIDLGLARRYRFRKNGQLQHIPFKQGRRLTGTARYVSINSHRGSELSRRDDMESMCYVLIQLLRKELPWKEDKNKVRRMTKQNLYRRIRNSKENTSPESLCYAIPCGPDFAAMLRYCRGLRFEQEPDYDYIDGLFLDMLAKIDAEDSGPFEWQELKRTDPDKLFSFECGFRWVLPKGQEPVVPPNRNFFGFQ